MGLLPTVSTAVVVLAAYVNVFRNFSVAPRLAAVEVIPNVPSGRDSAELDRAFAALRRYVAWDSWNTFTFNIRVLDSGGVPSEVQCEAGNLCPGQHVGFTVRLQSPLFWKAEEDYDLLDLDVRCLEIQVSCCAAGGVSWSLPC